MVYLKTPIIVDETSDVISTIIVRLIRRAKDRDFRKNNFNARIETVDENFV
jgi:hypothetical protein